MELYQKPVMEILELEKVDILTSSCDVFGHKDSNSDNLCDKCGASVTKSLSDA